ncbi:hypothetical protein [uncultured Lutibacter sp.]|uniref:hypothetical protein n=1 Tax=uncultured Lutibacter sp. TaxID=437739 RepID=UPI002615E538|nr:hypothetical protein [uncultured Lutibacter sp.]
MTHKNFEIQEIENAFERIRTHKLFKRSALHIRILRYLIDQAIAKNDVKEQTIGIELLNENYDSEQKNSKVRVYVYNLRKKLDEYYEETADSETIMFHIEKGQYNLSFKQNIEEKASNFKQSYFKFQISKKLLFITLGLLLISLLGVFIIKNNRPTYLWKPYLSKNNSLCVIADKFIVSDRTSKKNAHFAMYPDIISSNTLEKYENENPNLDLKKSSFTMLTKMAPFGIHYLDQWFHKFNSSFDLLLESDVQFSDYADKNVIYIGQSKYMTTSKSLFLKNSKVFKAEIDGYSFKSAHGIKKYVPQIYKVNYKEYAMVSYQKMDNGNYALFFVSNHDIGVIATLKMFTSKEQLKEFYKKIPNPNSEFNALFEVNGLQRNDMNCELIELEIID